MVGTFTRIAPMNMPGTILSQLGMQIMRVEAVRLDHRLDAVGDQLARGERILHAVVAHGDAVVDADGVEQERHAAGGPHALLDVVAHGLQMDVPGNDVDVAVADGDERLVPVAFAHARWPGAGCGGRRGRRRA